MGSPPNRYRTLMHSVLALTYGEQHNLLGAGAGPGGRRREAPLSTERSIVARLALHASAELSSQAPFLKTGAVVDVEYERVGDGRDPKLIGTRKISPDLIVHRRTDATANFLAVEVKNSGSVRRRAHRSETGVPSEWPPGKRLPDRRDLEKVHTLVTRPDNTGPYEMGLCLELHRHGADLWWVSDDDGLSYEQWSC